MTQSPDLYEAAIQMVCALGLVLIIIFGISYGIRRLAQGDTVGKRDRLIQVVATQYMGGKKSIAIVKVAEAFLIIGITSDRINLLARLGKDEVAHLPPLDSDPEQTPSFVSALTSIISKAPRSR